METFLYPNGVGVGGNLNIKPRLCVIKQQVVNGKAEPVSFFADHSGLRVKAELRPMHAAQF